MAVLGCGVERPAEFTVPYVMARAAMRGAIDPRWHRAAGWASVVIGMPRFDDLWVSLVSGDGDLRVGISAPSGYDPLLQVLALELGDMGLDTVFELQEREEKPWEGASGQACFSLEKDAAEIVVEKQSTRLPGRLRGGPGARCAKAAHLASASLNVRCLSFGWSSDPEKQRIWMGYERGASSPAEATIVGVRGVRGGALRASKAGAAAPADRTIMPAVPAAPRRPIHINDGLALDVLAHIEGLSGWQGDPEFQRLAVQVFRHAERGVISSACPRASATKKLWDIEQNAGMIEGSATRYVVLPDGEIVLVQARKDQSDRASKFLHG